MKYIYFLVEGQTEEMFVKELLAPHFHSKGIYAIPKLVVTKKERSGLEHKGGISNYNKIRPQIFRFLNEIKTDALITSMFDYFKLPNNFPGMASRPPTTNVYQIIQHLENELAKDINSRHFIPYFQVHEFEALLFSNVSSFELVATPTQVQGLEIEAAQFSGPELINSTKGPSYRIDDHIPGYDKVEDGNYVALDIGLQTMRDKCPHFNQWLCVLEKGFGT